MDTHHSTQSLIELAEQVAAAAKSISQHLRSKSLQDPSFHPSSAGLPDDPEIRAARQTLSISSRALSILSHDPLSHIRETVLQFNECSALGFIVDWKIAHILNRDGTPLHISQLSRESGADEYTLASALRMLTTQYIFAETKPGYFAHNRSSVYLIEKQFESLVIYSLDPLIKGSLKVGEAMKRYPGSTRPEETGFAVGNNTELALFQWLVAHPKVMQHFNQCLEVMAKSSYHRLRTVYPWRVLGKAKVIDIGGGNGHVSYQLAREAPDLEFIIQDLTQPISEAIEKCPEDLRSRFDFQVVDFMESQKVEADVYFMRLILHFLNDEDCIRLIKNIVQAMTKKDSRILVAESIVPRCGYLPNPMHRYVFNQNWNMITVLNAKERTFEEFAELFRKADDRFILKQWGETGGAPSSEILEATLGGEKPYSNGVHALPLELLSNIRTVMA